KTERRFVEDEQNGFGHQAPPDCQHLLLAARKTAGALRLPLGKARKNTEDLFPILLSAIACSTISSELEIVPYAQVGKNAAPFRYVSESTRDNSRRLFPRDCMPREQDPTFRGTQHSGDCPV